jgi:WD40 repeat protein
MYLLLSSIYYRGHDDEVLDVAFDFTGERIVTASSDGKLRS